MPMPGFARRLAALLALLAAGAVQADAQREPRLPHCTAVDIDLQPCLAPYDVAPVLAAELPQASDRRGMTHVWMLVDETGVVRATQVGRSGGGADWDLAAVERAKQLRFQPAMHGGFPAPVWILLPVPAVPLPQTCADVVMGAPLSAGVATFVDSTVFPEPQWGTAYHYASLGGFGIDLFVYPAAEHEAGEVQIEQSIDALRSREVDTAPDSLVVVSRGRERVRAYPSGGGAVFTGQSARLRMWFGGERAESYIAIFPVRNGFVKVRATYPLRGYGREIVAEFVRQVMTHRAWREQGCPREVG
jgi:hypothetical protein